MEKIKINEEELEGKKITNGVRLDSSLNYGVLEPGRRTKVSRNKFAPQKLYYPMTQTLDYSVWLSDTRFYTHKCPVAKKDLRIFS